MHRSSLAPAEGRSSTGSTYESIDPVTHQVEHEHVIPVKLDAKSSVGRRDQRAHVLDSRLDQSTTSTVVPRRLLSLHVDPLLDTASSFKATRACSCSSQDRTFRLQDHDRLARLEVQSSLDRVTRMGADPASSPASRR